MPRWTEDEAPESEHPWWVLHPGDVLRLLDGWPLLRQLAVERRFRWAGFLVAVLILGLVVVLPRVWIVTPPGCRPVIRVSGIDFFQAQLHRRRSQAAWRVGNVETAIFEWRQALANQPASRSILRIGLERLAERPSRDPVRLRLAVGSALWLLEVTQTNRADLDLALRVFEAFGVDDLVLASIGRLKEPLTPLEYASELKARFRLGDVNGFAARWKGWTGQSDLDAELTLYRAAWVAGWGRPDASGPAEQYLFGARTNSQQAALARRLSLLAQARRNDFVRYSQTLEELDDLRESTAIHHVAAWRLLANLGRSEEAQRRALQFAAPPRSALEVRRLAEAFFELGLEESALALLERYVPELGFGSDLWVFRAQEFVKRERWQDVRSVAIELRNSPLARHSLDGYSHFLDGLYHHSRGALEAAGEAFGRAASSPIQPAGLAERVAGEMLALGHPRPALDLLLTREAELVGSAEYWRLLTQAAFETWDMDLVLRAARRHWELRPDDASAMNTLAAGLIIQHAETELLLYLTRRVFEANPDLLPARLNRASALLQAGRKAEAGALLALIEDSAELAPTDRAMICLARIEQRAAEGNAEETLRELRRLNPDFLLPPQAERVAAIRRELGRLGEAQF